MPDGCHNCKYRLELHKLTYKRGCKHEKMEGFVCLAMADEGIANWMVGLDADDSKCEVWVRKEREVMK